MPIHKPHIYFLPPTTFLVFFILKGSSLDKVVIIKRPIMRIGLFVDSLNYLDEAALEVTVP